MFLSHFYRSFFNPRLEIEFILQNAWATLIRLPFATNPEANNLDKPLGIIMGIKNIKNIPVFGIYLKLSKGDFQE